MSLRDTIISSMARTLWVTAWADELEERSRRHDVAARARMRDWPQKDLMDLAPETPQAAKNLASKLAFTLESEGPCVLEDALTRALWADLAQPSERFSSRQESVEEYAGSFGHYLAMEALGHGVAWSDDHVDHVFDMPMYFDNFELRSEVKR